MVRISIVLDAHDLIEMRKAAYEDRLTVTRWMREMLLQSLILRKAAKKARRKAPEVQT
jgi:hypothetical protein